MRRYFVPFGSLIAAVGAIVIWLFSGFEEEGRQTRTIRAQVAEGLKVSGNARAGVTEFFKENSVWPKDNYAIGLAPANEIVGNYVSGVSVEDGVVVVTYGNSAQASIQGHSIWFEPDASNLPNVSWNCYRSDIANVWLPAVCRSD